jgi:small subunit ribosomal protein S16
MNDLLYAGFSLDIQVQIDACVGAPFPYARGARKFYHSWPGSTQADRRKGVPAALGRKKPLAAVSHLFRQGLERAAIGCRVSQTDGTSYNLRQEEVFVLAIRLARIGKKKHPFYRVVVLDKRKPRNGRTVEVVGTYDPLKNPAEIKLDADRIKYWLGCGAQPSDTVRSFLHAQKIA